MFKRYTRVISKILVLIFMFVLVPSNGVSANEEETKNLLKNGSFESNLNSSKDWSPWSASTDFSAKESTKEHINGNRSLELSSSSSCRAFVSQRIDASLLVKNSFKLTQYIKARNFKGSFQIRGRYVNSEGKDISSDTKTVYISNSDKWEFEEFNFNLSLDRNVKYFCIDYIYDGTGEMYLDDVKAYSLDENMDNSILKNKGFEEDFSYWSTWDNNSQINIGIDKDNHSSGKKSVKLSNEKQQQGRGLIGQKVDLKDHLGETINLGFDIKAKEFNGNIQVRTKFLDSNGKEAAQSDLKNVYINSNSDWTRKNFNIDIPNNKNITSAEVAFIYESGVGIIWIDGIEASFIKTVNSNNLIKNSSFEEDFSYWVPWDNEAQINIGIDEKNYLSGKKSVKLSNEKQQQGRGLIGQKVSLKDHLGETIDLGLAVKTKGFSGSVQIRTKFLDSSGNKVIALDTKTISINSNSDWIKKSYDINIPNNKDICLAEVAFIYDLGVGTVWIDDIEASFKKCVSSNNIIKNGSFNEDISYWGTYKSKGTFLSTIDSNVKKDESPSLHLSTSDNTESRGIVSQKIEIGPDYQGKVINVSQWIKSNNLNGDGIEARIKFFSNNSEVSEEQSYLLGSGKTEDWKQDNFNIFIPDNYNVTTIELDYIYNASFGDFWIDDIEARENKEHVNRSIIVNSSFETTTSDIVNSWGLYEGDFYIDSSNAYSGSNSLKLTSKNELSNPRIKQHINITDEMLGKSLKLSEVLKSDTSNNIIITLKYMNSNDEDVADVSNISHSISGDKSWKTYSDIFTVPNNKKITKLAIEYKIRNISGSVWIDSASLEPFKEVKNVSVDSGFLKLKDGEKKTCKLNLEPKNLSNVSLELSSEDNSIFRVNNNKEIEAVSQGVAKLKVVQPYQNSSWEIPVVVYNDSINVEQSVSLEVKQDETIQDKVKTTLSNKLKYSMFVEPNHGYVDLSKDGIYKYYPDKTYVGSDSFTIKVQNEQGKISLIQYNIDVKNKKFKLDDNNIMLTLTQGEECKGTLNVKCNENIKLAIDKSAKNGRFQITDDGDYAYKPNDGYFGYDEIKLKAINENNETDFLNVKIYIAPSKDTIESKLISKHPNSLINQEKFDEIKEQINDDKNIKKWFGVIKDKADKMLSLDVVPYKENGINIDTSSIEIIELLSFMYKVTDNPIYAERAYKEIENVCNYKAWEKDEFLDVSKMAVAVSLGYDWLYDYLSSKQRNLIQNAVLDKALKSYENVSWLDENKNNWSIVCNSGMIFSALTIAGDTDSDLPISVLEKSLKSMQNSLSKYYIDGSCVEGPAYWQFSTEYLIYSSTILENVLKINAPFDSIVDFDKVSEYPLYINSSNGTYNYADSNNSEYINSYISLWLAQKTNNHELIKASKMAQKKNRIVSIFDLMWYNKGIYCDSVSSDLDKLFDENQIVTMRSDFINDYSTFAAIKGGDTSVAHGDLDIGSFVYDALGVRWALDIGSDDYSLSGYWDADKLGKRWSYYSKQAKGHNTLVIGSSKNEDQVVGSISKIVDTNLNCDNPYAVVDMTPAYADKAVNVTRKIQFLNNRKDLNIEDDFLLKENQDIIWQMHTLADVQILNDGKTLILSQDGQKLRVSLASDCNIKFEVQELSQKVNNIDKKVRKIIAKTNSKKGKIKVELSPQGDISKMKPIIKNGNFETGTLDNSGWYTWNQTGNLDTSIDSKVKNKGDYSVKLSNLNNENARGSFYQFVDVADYADKKVKLSQNIKSNIKSGTMYFRYNFLDENKKEISKKIRVDLPINNEWTNSSTALQIPSKAKFIAIEYIYDNASGPIWIDDIEAYSLEGDLNDNNSVDSLDLAMEASKYNKKNTDSGWDCKYDFNNDNIIDIYDIVYLASRLE